MKSWYRRVVVVVVSALAFGAVAAENAFEYVMRRSAEVMKIDQDQIGAWNRENGNIVVVGLAALQNKTLAEIFSNRHKLAQIAIMDAKLQLSEKLGGCLSAEEKRQLWGVSNSEIDMAGSVMKSRLEFLSKHRILGASVLLQGESNLNGEYLMAVSLVWSRGLEKSAQTILNGRGVAETTRPGKLSLEEWMKTKIDPALVVGPRQYVDNTGRRHFIGIVSMPYNKEMPPQQRLNVMKVLKRKGVTTVAWALRGDVETSTVSTKLLKQISVDGKEEVSVASQLEQFAEQRFRGLTPPVKDLFEDTYIIREHPLFPGSYMMIYACELSGAFVAPVPK